MRKPLGDVIHASAPPPGRYLPQKNRTIDPLGGCWAPRRWKDDLLRVRAARNRGFGGGAGRSGVHGCPAGTPLPVMRTTHENHPVTGEGFTVPLDVRAFVVSAAVIAALAMLAMTPFALATGGGSGSWRGWRRSTPALRRPWSALSSAPSGCSIYCLVGGAVFAAIYNRIAGPGGEGRGPARAPPPPGATPCIWGGGIRFSWPMMRL